MSVNYAKSRRTFGITKPLAVPQSTISRKGRRFAILLMAAIIPTVLSLTSGNEALADCVQIGVDQRIKGDSSGASQAAWTQEFGKPAVRLESTRGNRAATEISFEPRILNSISFSFKKAKTSPDPVLRVEFLYTDKVKSVETFRLSNMVVHDTPGGWKAVDFDGSFISGYRMIRAAVVARGESEGLLDLHRADFTVAAFHIDGKPADRMDVKVQRRFEKDRILNY